MQTNQMLATSAWTYVNNAACGASLVAVSATLSSPDNVAYPQGRVTVFLTTEENTEPFHVQARCTFTDASGAEQSLPLAAALLSNPQAYASAQSAAQFQSLMVLPCGMSAAFPLEGVAGSVVQIVIMAASAVTSTVSITGMASIWRL